MLLEEFVRRELASGEDVELVPAEEDARAVLFKAPVAELGYHVQRLGGVLLCERRQRVQPLAELRQSHRDYRHAVHPGVQRLEVAHRAHKLLSVVEAGAADDLAVHRDAGFREAAHGVYRLSGARIAQHGAAQLRICRVDGDVYRAYMQRDDALYLALREVRKRDVVAEKEAQARVVILEVHGAAHALRELVDEAENAVVRAGARRVHQVALELKPKVAANGLADVHLALTAVGAAENDVQLAVVGEELVVEHVYYFVAVY